MVVVFFVVVVVFLVVVEVGLALVVVVVVFFVVVVDFSVVVDLLVDVVDSVVDSAIDSVVEAVVVEVEVGIASFELVRASEFFCASSVVFSALIVVCGAEVSSAVVSLPIAKQNSVSINIQNDAITVKITFTTLFQVGLNFHIKMIPTMGTKHEIKAINQTF